MRHRLAKCPFVVFDIEDGGRIFPFDVQPLFGHMVDVDLHTDSPTFLTFQSGTVYDPVPAHGYFLRSFLTRASATQDGTKPLTFPPNRAISLMMRELR